MDDINKLKKELDSGTINQSQSNDIDEQLETFLQSLENNQNPEEIKEVFGKLIQALTMDAFTRIKETADEKEQADIKKELQETVATIATLADNYLQTRDNL